MRSLVEITLAARPGLHLARLNSREDILLTLSNIIASARALTMNVLGRDSY